jgi:hypothetical protein
MTHYDFPKQFSDVYQRALATYREGCRDAASLLAKADLEFAASIGSRAQDFFDYAEDATNYGEPDFETALLVQAIRRDYFLQVQHGRASAAVLDADTMPAKTDAIRGIEWLPRLIPKARAKLRGELPSSLMYGCGGDRRFFKQHDIHPAEFLRVVWAHETNDPAIIAWVEARSKGTR